MASKNGEKEALEELQRRKWTLPCLFDRQDREGTGGRVIGGQMDVSVPHLTSLACPCLAVPRGLYSGDGPVYYNKKSHRWVEQITPLRKTRLMLIY